MDAFRSNRQSQHLIEISRIISDRIHNCKSLFFLWLDLQYILYQSQPLPLQNTYETDSAEEGENPVQR